MGRKLPVTDAEIRHSIKGWYDYLEEDSRPIPAYLQERGAIDPDELKFRIDAREFISADVHKRETERLWERVWQTACRENEIPDVGDYFEYEICGNSIIVVRENTSSIRAFRNACRHRGTALIAGSGNARAFACPFHGWLYGLDGALRKIPAAWNFDHVDPACHGLLPVRAEAFDGWIFVNLDPAAPPLREHLGETVMRHLSMNPQKRMQKAMHFGVVVPCNWKLLVGNFIESYHLTATHPGLASFTGDIQGVYEFFGQHHRFAGPMGASALIGGAEYSPDEILSDLLSFSGGGYGSASGSDERDATDIADDDPASVRRIAASRVRKALGARGIDLDTATDAELIDLLAYFIFPNLDWFICPAGRINFRVRPHGDDPGQCLFEIMAFTPIPESSEMPRDVPMTMIRRDETFADHAAHLGPAAAVIDEDIMVVTAAQKGLRSGLPDIVLGSVVEAAIANFHRHVKGWTA